MKRLCIEGLLPFLNIGKYERALKDLRKAGDKNPKDPVIKKTNEGGTGKVKKPKTGIQDLCLETFLCLNNYSKDETEM